jgi:CRP/FNR family transcriptional regulator, cyclic AMP receptor protein
MTFQFPAAHRLEYVDQVIFREGDQASTAYVIESGEVEIFTNHEGIETTHERLGPGEIIAEMALFEAAPHSASARAVGVVTLRPVTESKLDALRDELAPRSWAMVSMMVMRLHATHGRLRHRIVSEEPAVLEVAA